MIVMTSPTCAQMSGTHYFYYVATPLYAQMNGLHNCFDVTNDVQMSGIHD